MSISSVQSAAASVPTLLSSGSPSTASRPTDGDTAAKEASESISTKMAETQNGGYAPQSTGLVNKTA
jgi:hypothetical protein